MTETRAKVKIGSVVSIKQDKSAVVRVDAVKTHPIYKKKFVVSQKFTIHDEKNECVVGDKVSIVETKPISKTKAFKLLKKM